MQNSLVLDIISAGAKFNLQELRFGDLHIRFGAYQPELNYSGEPVPSATMPNLGEQSEVLPEEEDRMLDDRLGQLIIENPMEAERLIIEGDLVDDVEGTDGEDDGEA